jgi:hypothetical protein
MSLFDSSTCFGGCVSVGRNRGFIVGKSNHSSLMPSNAFLDDVHMHFMHLSFDTAGADRTDGAMTHAAAALTSRAPLAFPPPTCIPQSE